MEHIFTMHATRSMIGLHPFEYLQPCSLERKMWLAVEIAGSSGAKFIQANIKPIASSLGLKIQLQRPAQ